MSSITDSGIQARNASLRLGATSAEERNQALQDIADALRENSQAIFQANQQDLDAATNLSAPLLKRLAFQEAKLQDVLEGIHSLQTLPDPLGEVLRATELDRNLNLYQVRCPIGVIGIIFESRPDALVQIATLALKSGNAVLLKGGSEAKNTNRILAETIRKATTRHSAIPEGWLQLLETREDVKEMLTLHQYIDLIIPRGSNAFVKYIMDNTEIPVMGHAEGLCHAYVDEDADLQMALDLVTDSKAQAVAVCNAIETLLVHQKIAPAFLPLLAVRMTEKKVTLLGCEKCREIVPELLPATDADWNTEYLDYKLSVKIVESEEEAIQHINSHGSKHTDMIVTTNAQHAATFTARVDSADVFWNASTRFADGFRFGLGAEVGIATGKLHARGPVGLEGLCTYKWLLCGDGQCVGDYASGRSSFTHKPITKKFPFQK